MLRRAGCVGSPALPEVSKHPSAQTADNKAFGHSGCRVQGAGSKVQGSGFRVQGSGCRVQVAGFRV